MCTFAPAARLRGQAEDGALSASCSAAPLLQGVLVLPLPAPSPTFELFAPLTAGQLVPCAPPASRPPALANQPWDEVALWQTTGSSQVTTDLAVVPTVTMIKSMLQENLLENQVFRCIPRHTDICVGVYLCIHLNT